MRERELILLFLIADVASLSFSLMLMAKIHYTSFLEIEDTIYLLNASWFITFLVSINERLFKVRNFIKLIKYLLGKFGIYVSVCSFLIVVINLDDFSRSMFLGSTFIFFIFKILLSYPSDYLIKRRKKGQYYSKIMVAGAGKTGESVLSYYNKHKDLGEVVGFLDDNKTRNNGTPILGEIAEFQKVFHEHPVNELIITLKMTKKQKIKQLIEQAEYNGVRPRIVADYNTMFKRYHETSLLGNLPVVNIREVPLSKYTNRFWKRAFDILFSIFSLLIHAPLLLIIAIAIKLESKGPVFFKPVRGGKRGTTFTLYKFRSMKVNDDPVNGVHSTKINDPRITKVGRIIRKLNLDELPQFYNVLRNEMSVVGPRPHRLRLNESFQKTIPSYMVRYYVKPGITGWAQVNGWRGPSNTKYQKKARTLFDIWYIEHWNFFLDLYIIFLTVFNIKSYRNNR
ncbi:MAG: exopolysaccharide biosynthesis polyprenyl glycosylphosphotransferase [Cytophagales bacterium]|nr:exopolysaccharide biosynthesis polyprenyl glycosylphosphotransferase [Cytophagales bacterium]